MKLVLLLVLLFASANAFAERNRHLLITATRYAEFNPEKMHEIYERLSQIEGSTLEKFELPPDTPLLDVSGQNDLFDLLRLKIMASNRNDKVLVDLFIDSHGSPDSIHSEQCGPVLQNEFANEFMSLLAEFKRNGFSSHRLSFRIFISSCYSGRLLNTFPMTSPYEVLVIASSAETSVSHTSILPWTLNQTVNLLEAAYEHGLRFCENCSRNEELFWIFQEFGRHDITTSSPFGPAIPPPQVRLIPVTLSAIEDRFAGIVHKMVQLYGLCLKNESRADRKFVHDIEGIFADDDTTQFLAEARALSNQLSEEEKTAYEILTLRARLDDVTRKDAEVMLHRLGQHRERHIRAAVGDILQIYYDLFDEPDDLFLRQLKNEISQENPSLFEIHRMQNHLKQYQADSPAYREFCETLLDFEKKMATEDFFK